MNAKSCLPARVAWVGTGDVRQDMFALTPGPVIWCTFLRVSIAGKGLLGHSESLPTESVCQQDGPTNGPWKITGLRDKILRQDAKPGHVLGLFSSL